MRYVTVLCEPEKAGYHLFLHKEGFTENFTYIVPKGENEHYWRPDKVPSTLDDAICQHVEEHGQIDYKVLAEHLLRERQPELIYRGYQPIATSLKDSLSVEGSILEDELGDSVEFIIFRKEMSEDVEVLKDQLLMLLQALHVELDSTCTNWEQVNPDDPEGERLRWMQTHMTELFELVHKL